MPEQTSIATATAGRLPAHGLSPGERAKMAGDTLSGKTSVAEAARRLGVSRKFVAAQAQLADDALRKAFEPPEPDKEALFYLPVTPGIGSGSSSWSCCWFAAARSAAWRRPWSACSTTAR